MKPFKNSLWAILLLALSFSVPSVAAGFGPGGGGAIVGAASTVATKNLTANRALVSNSSGKIAVASSITSTELGYLDGVTSGIQTQFSGKADSSHNHAAADINSGTVATARLGSGTASSSTYLRGDQTWATVSAGDEWQSATQASNGNSLTLTLSPTGNVFQIVGQITSASASSATEIEFNGSTGGHSYRHLFSAGEDSNSGGYFPPGIVGSGVTVYFHGFIHRKGEEITAVLTVTLPDSENSVSVVKKTITGASAITSLRFLSNQASGIGAGSFAMAKKIA